jgi:hypothetical protein
MSNRYGLYGCGFNAGEGYLALNQVSSVGTRTNKTMHSVHASGSIDPSAHIMTVAKPVLAIETADFTTLFGDADAPVSISTGLDVDDVATFMYRRRVVGGAFDSGNFHSVQTCEAGFLHVTEISAEAESQDPAKAMLEFIALSLDGDNPFTFTDDQAIPGALVAPAFNSVFHHGPAFLNSVALPGLIRTVIRPGIGHKARHPDGGVFPRRAASSINSRDPQFQLDFLKVDMADNAIGDLLVAAFSTTLACYFQRGSTNRDGRVAKATTQHLMISAPAGSWGGEDVSVIGEDDAVLSVLVQPTGTLSLSITSAIPT